MFTVHDFAGIKWSVDTAIEFHEDKNAYALLRCNAWDSVIDLEEVFYCRLLCDFFTALTLDLPLLGVRCLHARVSLHCTRDTHKVTVNSGFTGCATS